MLCSGRKLAAFGLTEPEAGSDAGNTRTRARLDGGEWVIDSASCRVPEANLLGRHGDGFTNSLDILDGGRIGVSAMGVGLAQGALDEALAYAKERRAFGQPISKHQAIQAKLTDLSVEMEAARLLTYRAALLKDRGEPFTLVARRPS